MHRADRSPSSPRTRALRAAAALLLGACGGGPKTAPCVPRFQSDLEAIETVPIHDRSAVMAATLADSCDDATHPMPKGLADALTRHAQLGAHAGIAMIGPALADVMLTSPDLWSTACGKSAAEVARALQAVAQNGGDGFLDACPVGALGFARAPELRPLPPAQLMLAGVAHAWLVREGARRALANRVARALAGL